MKPQSCGGVQAPKRGLTECLTLREQGEAALSGKGRENVRGANPKSNLCQENEKPLGLD